MIETQFFSSACSSAIIVHYSLSIMGFVLQTTAIIEPHLVTCIINFSGMCYRGRRFCKSLIFLGLGIVPPGLERGRRKHLFPIFWQYNQCKNDRSHFSITLAEGEFDRTNKNKPHSRESQSHDIRVLARVGGFLDSLEGILEGVHATSILYPSLSVCCHFFNVQLLTKLDHCVAGINRWQRLPSI